MPHSPSASDRRLEMFRHTVVDLVRRDGRDLSARQLAMFLVCYLDEGPHTVRGLAAGLNVSKPAITRALDRLGTLGLARRAPEPGDRRGIVVQRTPAGRKLLADMRGLLTAAA
jgi:DNA-binding MarR family transcriptional regulator